MIDLCKPPGIKQVCLKSVRDSLLGSVAGYYSSLGSNQPRTAGTDCTFLSVNDFLAGKKDHYFMHSLYNTLNRYFHAAVYAVIHQNQIKSNFIFTARNHKLNIVSLGSHRLYRCDTLCPQQLIMVISLFYTLDPAFGRKNQYFNIFLVKKNTGSTVHICLISTLLSKLHIVFLENTQVVFSHMSWGGRCFPKMRSEPFSGLFLDGSIKIKIDWWADTSGIYRGSRESRKCVRLIQHVEARPFGSDLCSVFRTDL